MKHDDLVLLALGAHAAVFLGALAAYYRFGDRTDITAKSLEGTDAVLREMRMAISAELTDHLRDTLSDSVVVSSIVLDAGASAYVEKPSNSLASDRFREAVRDFVEESSEHLAACRSLFVERSKWSRTSRKLSWLLLLLAVWQGLVSGVLAFVDRPAILSIPDRLILLFAVPTALLGLGVVVTLVVMQVSHDRICEIRDQHAAL